MMLYEEGRFQLDDPISKYLPEFAKLRVLRTPDAADSDTVPMEREPTIHDLLRHTAGFGGFEKDYLEADLLGRNVPLSEVITRLAKLPLRYQPGTKSEYSLGPDVTARLVEIFSGMSFDQFLDQRLLGPLAMKDTGFWVKGPQVSRLAAVHWLKQGTLVPCDDVHGCAKEPFDIAFLVNGYNTEPAHKGGNNGLAGTAVDYWRFAQMMLDGGRFAGRRFLSPSTVRYMTRDHMGSIPMPNNQDLPKGTAWGRNSARWCMARCCSNGGRPSSMQRTVLIAGCIVSALLIGTTVAAVDDAQTPGSHLRSIPVTAPAEETKAIRLSGRSVNTAPEVWERRQQRRLAGGGTAVSISELWVRNVSQPSLEVFLPEKAKATGAAMIVAPGGGFVALAMEREGYTVAHWLTERGIAAFVLKYRLAPTPADSAQTEQFEAKMYGQLEKDLRERGHQKALSLFLPASSQEAMLAARQDGVEAVEYVRSHAPQYGVWPHRIGFMGFSAGAITALGVALQSDSSSRPDLLATIYGGMPTGVTVSSAAMPIFIAAASDDQLAPYSLSAYNAWHAAGVPAELHILEDGGHGFGMLLQGKSSDHWPDAFDHWLRAQGFETPATKLH